MSEIKLLSKPLFKWTEVDVVIETIKLWSFLAEDGDRTKQHYFETLYFPVRAGCFLCAYYFDLIYAQYKFEGNKALTGESGCNKFGCCLSSKFLCGFNYTGSAFNQWYGTENKHVRKRAARQIVSACKRRYREITGEDYYEK